MKLLPEWPGMALFILTASTPFPLRLSEIGAYCASDIPDAPAAVTPRKSSYCLQSGERYSMAVMLGVYAQKARRFLLLAAWFVLAVAGPAARGDAEADHFNFAQGLFVQRDYLSAREEYTAFLKKYPKSASRAEARYRLAECFFRTEKYKQATAAYTAALAEGLKAGQAGLAWYNLGRAHVALRQVKQAAAAFQRAMKDGEGVVREEAAIGAGEQLIELKRSQEARTILSDFLESYPKSARKPDVLSSLAWVESTLGNHQAAVDIGRSLLKEFPASKHATRTRLVLSDSLTALKQYDQAAEVLSALSADKDVAKDVALRQAWNSFKRGQREEAAKRFLAYAKQYHDDTAANSALYNAGVAHFESKQYAKSAPVFAQLLARETTAAGRHEANYWLGMSHHHLGKYADALKALEPLARQADSMPATRQHRLFFTVGQALAAAGKHDAAIQFFDRLVKAAPNAELALRARYAKALEQEAIKDVDGAIATIEQLLQQKVPEGLGRDARFALAEYLYRQGRAGDARPHLEQLRAADKDPSPRLLYRLAWTYYDLKDYAKAVTPLEALSARKSAYRREAAYMLGRCHENRDAPARAIAVYGKLVAEPDQDPFIERALYRLGCLQGAAEAAAVLEQYRKRFPQGTHLLPLELRAAEQALAKGDTKAATRRFGALAQQKLPADLQGDVSYGLAWCRLKQDQLGEADTLFASVAASAAADAKKNDALQQRGEIAYRQQEYDKAATFLVQVKGADLDADRRERLLYMRAWSYRQAGERVQAAAHFRNLVRDFPGGSYATDGAVRLAEALREDGKLAEADTILQDARKKGARKKYEEELLHLHAAILVGLESWKQATETCQLLLTTYPDSKQVYLAHFRAGVAQKALGLHAKAQASFEATIKHTDTVEAARAQFNLAALLYEQKKFLDAARGFLRVDLIYDYPQIAPKALHHAVRAFRDAGEAERAASYTKQLEQRFPQSEWTRKAKEAN